MEINLTYVVQIAHFFIIWFLFHTLLLKKVFFLIKKRKKEMNELAHSIADAQRFLNETLAEQQRKKEELLVLFSQKIPSLKDASQEIDKTIMPSLESELTSLEEKKVIEDTTDYILKRISRDH